MKGENQILREMTNIWTPKMTLDIQILFVLFDYRHHVAERISVAGGT